MLILHVNKSFADKQDFTWRHLCHSATKVYGCEVVICLYRCNHPQSPVSTQTISINIYLSIYIYIQYIYRLICLYQKYWHMLSITHIIIFFPACAAAIRLSSSTLLSLMAKYEILREPLINLGCPQDQTLSTQETRLQSMSKHLNGGANTCCLSLCPMSNLLQWCW